MATSTLQGQRLQEPLSHRTREAEMQHPSTSINPWRVTNASLHRKTEKTGELEG